MVGGRGHSPAAGWSLLIRRERAAASSIQCASGHIWGPERGKGAGRCLVKKEGVGAGQPTSRVRKGDLGEGREGKKASLLSHRIQCFCGVSTIGPTPWAPPCQTHHDSEPAGPMVVPQLQVHTPQSCGGRRWAGNVLVNQEKLPARVPDEDSPPSALSRRQRTPRPKQRDAHATLGAKLVEPATWACSPPHPAGHGARNNAHVPAARPHPGQCPGVAWVAASGSLSLGFRL